MKRLSKEEENEIRNKLDYIADGLYKDYAPASSLKWAHKTIKRLLFDVHMLQKDLEDKIDENG